MRSIDTYVGRCLTNIVENGDGTWHVELEGKVLVANLDPAIPVPEIPLDILPNLKFIMVTLEATRTTLVCKETIGFEEYRVIYNPLKYVVLDRQHSPDAFNPQMPVEAPAPAPYPSERVVDGPEFPEPTT